MSVSYFVRYDIAVPDLPAFLERYRKVNVPLASTWPGLQRVVMHSGNTVLMQFEFDDERAMNHEGFQKLIQFEGSVVQEAMRATEVWRSPWLDANEEQA